MLNFLISKLLNFGIPDERNAVSRTATRRFSLSEKPTYSMYCRFRCALKAEATMMGLSV